VLVFIVHQNELRSAMFKDVGNLMRFQTRVDGADDGSCSESTVMDV